MPNLLEASKMLEVFRGESLSDTVMALETSFVGATVQTIPSIASQSRISADLLIAALIVKRNASQINEIVHTLGILLALPGILEPGERVESLSLAAGNTGKGFDLETDRRVAEFTFIQWQGGAEVIRQNKIFKDFYFLAEAETMKRRELYLMGAQHADRFFNSRRGIAKILDNNAKLGAAFRERHGAKFAHVRDYYVVKKDIVAVVDVTPHLPRLDVLLTELVGDDP